MNTRDQRQHLVVVCSEDVVAGRFVDRQAVRIGLVESCSGLVDVQQNPEDRGLAPNGLEKLSLPSLGT